MSGVVSHELQWQSEAHKHVHAAYAEKRDLASGVALHRQQKAYSQGVHGHWTQPHSHHQHGHQLLWDACEAVARNLKTGDHGAEQEDDAREHDVARVGVKELRDGSS